MADEVKPITTTQFTNTDKPRTIEFGAGNPADDAAKNEDDKQKVKVRALRSFHEDSERKGKMLSPGDEFDCPKLRAAELRANGLIEYVSESDEKDIHGEVEAKQIAARVDLRDKTEKAVIEKNKTTPLRNPELKLGEVKDADKPK